MRSWAFVAAGLAACGTIDGPADDTDTDTGSDTATDSDSTTSSGTATDTTSETSSASDSETGPCADGDPCEGGICHGGDCCTGCWDGATCQAGDEDDACGTGGAVCGLCAGRCEGSAPCGSSRQWFPGVCAAGLCSVAAKAECCAVNACDDASGCKGN